MTDQLPTAGPEGTPDLPPNLLLAVERLAPGWRHAIVWGRATVIVKERPAVEPRMAARLADVAGQRGATRKTIDVPRLLESVSLRVQHEDGTRAYSCWCHTDKAKGWSPWQFTGAGVMEAGQAPDYEIGWSEFYANIQWVPADDSDDEMEQAA